MPVARETAPKSYRGKQQTEQLTASVWGRGGGGWVGGFWRRRRKRKMVQVQCCFKSMETIRTIIRDGELRTATSTFTQLLRSFRERERQTETHRETETDR